MKIAETFTGMLARIAGIFLLFINSFLALFLFAYILDIKEHFSAVPFVTASGKLLFTAILCPNHKKNAVCYFFPLFLLFFFDVHVFLFLARS
jgi:hypothetical protein